MNQQASAARRTILVIDDDPDVRQVVSWVLEDAGFVVHTAADGQSALDQATRHHPAVVVLDIGLPRADGTLVAADLRKVCGDTLPILVMTADGRAADKASRAGAFAYLHKPFEGEALVQAVKQGISRGDYAA